MENARAIWEELKLPELNPQFPWHGYTLGYWCDNWEECAKLAAQSDWLENGKRTGTARKKLPEPQTTISRDEAASIGILTGKSD